MQDHADLNQWIEEVEMLEEERHCVEVSHYQTADAWIQIGHGSDVESGASTYAYKVADIYTKLADQCMWEWDKALRKVKENCEEDACQQLAEDKATREEEEQIWQENEEAMTKDDQTALRDSRKHKWVLSPPTPPTEASSMQGQSSHGQRSRSHSNSGHQDNWKQKW